MRWDFHKSFERHLPCSNGLGIYQRKKQNPTQTKLTDELLKMLYLSSTFGIGDAKLIGAQISIDFWYTASHWNCSELIGTVRPSAAYEKSGSKKTGKKVVPCRRYIHRHPTMCGRLTQGGSDMHKVQLTMQDWDSTRGNDCPVSLSLWCALEETGPRLLWMCGSECCGCITLNFPVTTQRLWYVIKTKFFKKMKSVVKTQL